MRCKSVSLLSRGVSPSSRVPCAPTIMHPPDTAAPRTAEDSVTKDDLAAWCLMLTPGRETWLAARLWHDCGLFCRQRVPIWPSTRHFRRSAGSLLCPFDYAFELLDVDDDDDEEDEFRALYSCSPRNDTTSPSLRACCNSTDGASCWLMRITLSAHQRCIDAAGGTRTRMACLSTCASMLSIVRSYTDAARCNRATRGGKSSIWNERPGADSTCSRGAVYGAAAFQRAHYVGSAPCSFALAQNYRRAAEVRLLGAAEQRGRGRAAGRE